MQIYFTSDWHLADGAWSKRPEIERDAFQALRALMYMLEPKDILLAAGDLFDVKRPPANNVLEMQKLITEASWTIYNQEHSLLYIQGQHEMQPEVPWMTLASGKHADFTVFEKHNGYDSDNLFYPCFVFDAADYSVQVYGLDWTLSLNLQERLDAIGEAKKAFEAQSAKKYANVRRISILMLHQTCTAVMAGTGPDRNQKLASLSYRSCELNDGMIPTGFDFVVVGDTHYHTEFTLLDKKGRETRCFSPGSFAMQSISETNVGKCFRLDPDTMCVESVELFHRPFYKEEIKDPVAFDAKIRELIKEPEGEYPLPIVRYDLYERDAERIDQMKKACVNKQHPFFYVTKEDAEIIESDTTTQLENVDEIIRFAIAEYDANQDAKDMLTTLVFGNGYDEILGTYYKEKVTNPCTES